MSPIQPVTALTIGGSLTFGIALAMLGHLKLAIARRSEPAAGRIDLLLMLLNLSVIPMMIAAGLLADCWGIRQTTILGSVLMSLSFLALSAVPAYWRSLIAVTAAATRHFDLWTANRLRTSIRPQATASQPSHKFGDHSVFLGGGAGAARAAGFIGAGVGRDKFCGIMVLLFYHTVIR